MTALLQHWFTFMNPARQALWIDLGLLITRLGFGFMMLAGHGWRKLSKYDTLFDTFSDPLGIGSSLSYTLAVGAEFFCSLLLMAGAATRLALTQLIVTMLVAGVIVHSADPLFGKPPSKEMALLYLTAFVLLFLTGPGRFSVDHWLTQSYQKAQTGN